MDQANPTIAPPAAGVYGPCEPARGLSAPPVCGAAPNPPLAAPELRLGGILGYDVTDNIRPAIPF
jgi:hypothetical protein